MKKTLLLLALSAFAVSCKKSKTTTPTQQNPVNTTQKIDGNWTIKEYDGLATATPAAGTIKFTGTPGSTTTGSVTFDYTFDGVIHMTENDNYTLTSSDTKIDFTKTGGKDSVLNGGSTWVVDTLSTNTLRMTSKYGLVIRATK